MDAGDILQFLGRRPFQPFRVYMTIGATFEFRHPELALVHPLYIQTYVPFSDAKESLPLGEQEIILALIHIVKIEFLRPDER